MSKVVSWNVHGINDIVKRRLVNEVISKKEFEILAIQEHRLDRVGAKW